MGKDMVTYQFAYSSRASNAISNQSIKAMLDATQIKNQSVKLSGILILHQGILIQLMEGGRTEVDQVFASTHCDTRHSDIQILYEGDVNQPSMPSWIIGFNSSDQSLDDVHEQSYHLSFDEILSVCKTHVWRHRKNIQRTYPS